ncbi:hypothetical protein DFH09DRAFT_1501878 [Mycena vulgaris]|nr:hypothetical protein DFH09DRAFT_1501878 [Mycena vulgaris]
MRLSLLLSLAAALTSRFVAGAPADPRQITLDQPGTRHARFQNIDFVFADTAIVNIVDNTLDVTDQNGGTIFSAVQRAPVMLWNMPPVDQRTTFHDIELGWFAKDATIMIDSEGPSGDSLIVKDPNGGFIFAAVAAV